MPNPRQGKVLLGLWLTKEEVNGLMEIIDDDNYRRRVGELIQKAKRRGDLIKR